LIGFILNPPPLVEDLISINLNITGTLSRRGFLRSATVVGLYQINLPGPAIQLKPYYSFMIFDISSALSLSEMYGFDFTLRIFASRSLFLEVALLALEMSSLKSHGFNK
jgi:hypothetical protein